MWTPPRTSRCLCFVCSAWERCNFVDHVHSCPPLRLWLDCRAEVLPWLRLSIACRGGGPARRAGGLAHSLHSWTPARLPPSQGARGKCKESPGCRARIMSKALPWKSEWCYLRYVPFEEAWNNNFISEPNISSKITSHPPPSYTHASFSKVGRFASAAQGRLRDACNPLEGTLCPCTPLSKAPRLGVLLLWWPRRPNL